MIVGELQVPKMDGQELIPGMFLIGEPTPVADTNKLRALADVGGQLCLIEMVMKFGGDNK